MKHRNWFLTLSLWTIGCQSAVRAQTTEQTVPKVNVSASTVTSRESFHIPFGPPLPTAMLAHSVGSVKWNKFHSYDMVSDATISPQYPQGEPYKMENGELNEKDALEPDTRFWREKGIRAELWTTRGIRIGETRRYYPSTGSLTVGDHNKIVWLYAKPIPRFLPNGESVPLQAYLTVSYEIFPNEPDHACFWAQVSYYPKNEGLPFPLPDMLVVEQCLIEAGLPLHHGFDSAKKAVELVLSENKRMIEIYRNAQQVTKAGQ
jgi:hypothetical protein